MSWNPKGKYECYVALDAAYIPDMKRITKESAESGLSERDVMVETMSKTHWLPQQWKKFCGMSYVFCADEIVNGKRENRKMAYGAFVGEEKKVLDMIWKIIRYSYYLKTANNVESPMHPVIVFADGKKYFTDLLVSRSMETREKFRDYSELSENDKKIMDTLNKGLNLFLNKEDKWEKYKPNYKNRYSEYTFDVSEHFLSASKSRNSEYVVAKRVLNDEEQIMASSLFFNAATAWKTFCNYLEIKNEEIVPDNVMNLDLKNAKITAESIEDSDKSEITHFINAYQLMENRKNPLSFSESVHEKEISNQPKNSIGGFPESIRLR